MVKINEIKKNKNVIDFQITLNKKCNLRCDHCYIEKYTDKEIEYQTLDNIFKYADNILSQKIFKIKEFDITLLGGEITLIKNIKKFKYILDKSEELILKYKRKTSIKILFFSNFINPFPKDLLNLLSNFIKDYKNNIFIVSSFETDTNRFNKEETYNKWIKNIKEFKNSVPNSKLVNSITLTKGTVQFIQEEKYKEVLELFDFIEYELLIINIKDKNQSRFLPEYQDLINLFDFQYKQKLKSFRGSNYSKTGIGFDKEYINKFNISPEGVVDFDNVVYDDNTFNINEVSTKKAINIFIKDSSKKIIDNTVFVNKNCNDCKYLNDCKGGFYLYRNNEIYENNYTFDNNHVCPGFYKLRKKLDS